MSYKKAIKEQPFSNNIFLRAGNGCIVLLYCSNRLAQHPTGTVKFKDFKGMIWNWTESYRKRPDPQTLPNVLLHHMMNHKHMSITQMSPTEDMCAQLTCLGESKEEDLCAAVLRRRLRDRCTMALKGSWGPCVSKNSSLQEEGEEHTD